MDVLKFFKELRARRGMQQVYVLDGMKFPLNVIEFQSGGDIITRRFHKRLANRPHLALYAHPTKKRTVGRAVIYDALTKNTRPATPAEIV